MKLLCAAFKFPNHLRKAKANYGGLNSGRPVTPPRTKNCEEELHVRLLLYYRIIKLNLKSYIKHNLL